MIRRSRWLALPIALAVGTAATAQQPRLSRVGTGWARSSVNAVIFRQSALVTHDSTQYTAFYDPGGYVVLARRTLGDTAWHTRRTQYSGNVRDAHNAISLGIDGTGVLHVAWDLHGDSLRYAQSVAPGSLELRAPLPMTGANERSITYPQFYTLASGDLLFAYRDGASGNGEVMLNRYDAGTRTWQALAHPLISGGGERNAYVNTIAIDGRGGWHVSWTWRETPDVASNHDILYAYSPDEGRTWLRSDGTRYRLPITAGAAEVAVAIPQGSGLINQTTMAVDARGTPYIATYWRPDSTGVPQYRLVWQEERTWRSANIGTRTTAFDLAGGGTRRIPVSRPLVLARDSTVHVVFRDFERGGGITLATSRSRARDDWHITDLYGAAVGLWEPAHDPIAWQRDGVLHLFVQRVGQGQGETLESLEPQPVHVLEKRLDLTRSH